MSHNTEAPVSRGEEMSHRLFQGNPHAEMLEFFRKHFGINQRQ